MTLTRKIGVGFAVVVALFVAFNIYYFLPRARKVMITQTEVQRRDTPNSSAGTGRTRDMLLIYATDYETKKPLVYRNEDNIFYFKVDSSDVASHAARILSSSFLSLIYIGLVYFFLGHCDRQLSSLSVFGQFSRAFDAVCRLVSLSVCPWP